MRVSLSFKPSWPRLAASRAAETMTQQSIIHRSSGHHFEGYRWDGATETFERIRAFVRSGHGGLTVTRDGYRLLLPAFPCSKARLQVADGDEQGRLRVLGDEEVC